MVGDAHGSTFDLRTARVFPRQDVVVTDDPVDPEIARVAEDANGLFAGEIARDQSL
ncbi:MAG: hypothetical protein V5A44_13255 [Haloarculaceae archaeon]